MKVFGLLLIIFLIISGPSVANGSEKRPPLLKGVSVSKSKVFISVAKKNKSSLRVILNVDLNQEDSVSFLAKKSKCDNKKCLYEINLKQKLLKKKRAAKKIKRNQQFQIFIIRKNVIDYKDYQSYLCQKKKRCILEKNLGSGGELKISNWPLYVGDNVLSRFEKKTNINIIYKEEIYSNEEFFNLIEPIFSNNSSGGRDIVVVSDWLAAYFNQQKFVQDFDKLKLPIAYRNLMPELKTISFDPERNYSLPWQSNMTGLLIRKDLAPGIKSVNDLFSPKYKGKVALSDQLYETVPLIMKAEGIDLVNATETDWLNAIAKINQAKKSGQLVGFSSSLHVPALEQGLIVAAMGRADEGFSFLIDRSLIKYIQPSEGCILWSDNILIPSRSKNVTNAHKFINYFYSATSQAKMTRYTNFVSPVPAANKILSKTNPGLAKSQLVFPTSSFLNKCSPQLTPPGNQMAIEKAWFNVVNE